MVNGRVTSASFEHIIQKLDSKLAGWKARYISSAGRATVSLSTLSSFALYSMQTAKVPRSICDEIDRKTRRFIWEVQRRKERSIWWHGIKFNNHAVKGGWASTL